MLGRLTGAGLAVGLALLGTSSAWAATISPSERCYRFAPELAGQQWVGFTRTGFTPQTDPAFNGVRLDYSSTDLAGFAPLAADGSFASRFLMPGDFLSVRSGPVKSYKVTAVDLHNPAVTASTGVRFVRAGFRATPARVRRRLNRRVRWAVYGAPSGARIFAHWTFKGRRHATRSIGRAKGPCGIARKRMPFLPARARTGTWRVFITRGREFKRRRSLFRSDLRVFSTR
jgi:hypothetical protein